MWGYILIAICAISGIVMLFHYGRSEKPIRRALTGMFSGAASLFAISYIGALLGLTIQINLFTAVVALTLGIPGTVLLMLCAIF